MKVIEVNPLTGRNLDGQIYQRTVAVEAQIIEALALNPDALLERVGLRHTVDGFFQEECLVYLIRQFQHEGQNELVNRLTESLIRRCVAHIKRCLGFPLDKRYVQECYDDVISTAFGQLLDLNSNRADFAQVRFWLWLDGVIHHELRGYWKRQRIDALSDSLDQESERDDEGDVGKTPDALCDQTLSADWRAVTEEALGILAPRERMVFLMRHYWELEIENQNPEVLTISRHFGVTPRTINNWLRGAEGKLLTWLRSKR